MAIKLLLGLAAIILVAFVYVAAPSVVVGDSDSDNLDAIVEKLGDIDVRLKAYELRVALDSYPIITGAGSAQSYAAKLNKPVNIADGHTLTVTAAGIVEKPREVDLPRSQRNTPPGFDLVRVSVMIQTPNAYNGETRFFTCEYDGHDTLATSYDKKCEPLPLFKIIDGTGSEENVLLGTVEDKRGLLWRKFDMYFQYNGNYEDMIVQYYHPRSSASERYWELPNDVE